MRALPADIPQSFRAEGVDFHPEHIEGGDLAQNLEIAFGLGVEVEVKQQVHVGSGAFAHGLQMQAQVMENVPVDIELGIKGNRKPWPPALGVSAAGLVEENVGLEGAETLLAYLAAHGLDAVELGDCRAVVGRMVDTPGGAVR